MVANILNSKRAIEDSIYVVRAFIKLREVLLTKISIPTPVEKNTDAMYNNKKVIE